MSGNKDIEEPENMDLEVDDQERGGIRIGDIYISPPPPSACTFDSTGPRLIITHIENVNFKSYAGKQVLGPFHKSFTSIVGPNGSGKSNVIDSMLFVFGYRAQKIRSKKISVVIHNSDTHPNVDSCTVSVHFQMIIDKESDDYEPVQNSQFAVSRTAFKDNSSFYCINGSRSQFKAVKSLLRSYGIDLDHNLFLILQMDIAQSELDLYLSTEKNEVVRFQEITQNYEKTYMTLKKKRGAIDELEKRLPEVESHYEKAKQELQGVKEEELKISGEVKSKQLKLEEARSAMHASRNRGRVIEALMHQKECGKLPGIFGRLGDLGAIADKYDVAISTACGSLDNIVTDTMTTAEMCVQFLKQHQIGVATFIALDKMNRWISYTKQKINTPEHVPRLFDLVQVKDERVLPAFYFALRDTLVADNLEQATRIGLQGGTRYRVVTLKGELIDLSGTMSGGGGKVARGRMGQSIISSEISGEEIDSMINHLDAMRKTSASLKERKIELEDMVERLQKEVSVHRHTLQMHKVEVQALTEQASALEQQLEDQKKKVAAFAPDEDKVKQMQKAVEVSKKAYDKPAGSAGEIEVKIQKIHSKIMEITEGRMGTAQKKLDCLNNQIDGITSAITKCGVAIKTAQRNIKKCEDKTDFIKGEIQENQDYLEKLYKEFKSLETEAQKVMKDLEEADKLKEQYDQQMQMIAKDFNALKEDENKINSNHIEVKNELDKCNTKIRDNHNKVRVWQDKLSKLTLQECDGHQEEPLPQLTNEELETTDPEAINYEILTLEERQKSMKPNMAAIAEYRKKEAHYLQRVAELDDINNQRDTQRRYCDDLRKQRLNEFMVGFSIITTKLKEMYQMITLGGDAELELVDSLDPFSEGIVFSVRPPKKSWKNISNLSGGEKTLSSLALVFALHYYKPAPFYVMDEIDAALDFKNVSIVGNYIKERTKNAQFIIISLRNNMFELADRLIGIYKTHNCTKSVTINPNLAEATVANDAPAEETNAKSPS